MDDNAAVVCRIGRAAEELKSVSSDVPRCSHVERTPCPCQRRNFNHLRSNPRRLFLDSARKCSGRSRARLRCFGIDCGLVICKLKKCGINGKVERVAARGAWGTGEWAADKEGSLPARADYERLDTDRKAKMAALFQRLVS